MHHGKKAKVRTIEGIDYKFVAAYIGLFQLIVAIFPGTSRSGATIVGALILVFQELLLLSIHFSCSTKLCSGASLLKGVLSSFFITQ